MTQPPQRTHLQIVAEGVQPESPLELVAGEATAPLLVLRNARHRSHTRSVEALELELVLLQQTPAFAAEEKRAENKRRIQRLFCLQRHRPISENVASQRPKDLRGLLDPLRNVSRRSEVRGDDGTQVFERFGELDEPPVVGDDHLGRVPVFVAGPVARAEHRL